ncbi:MAG: PepSY-associated TM helix domain-containing protein [Betaproteobacteria bacterium]
MRRLLVTIHRWFGLAAAAFLFVSGATGAVISWDHELDAWLNPDLFAARTPGAPLPALELARRAEAADPRVQVSYLPMLARPGETLLAYVEPRLDPATRKPFEPGYNQVAIDPATGALQGRREWGAVSLALHDLLPFLYKLHYSMHLPAVGGYEVGTLLMGVIAVAWVFDTLIALWISFPGWKAWRRSFALRWRAGGHKLVFDLHRSGGVWLFLLVLTIAVTSVAMNLNTQVMRPLVGLLSPLSPSPFDGRPPIAADQQPPPRVTREQALALAGTEARRRGWTAPAGGLLVEPEFGVYGVGFFDAAHSAGDGGLGNPWLYVDMRSGAIVSADVPGSGSAGDIFLQAMFPLHSGRIIGLPGRILMSLMGAAVAMFSATGVLIWARKRKARAHARAVTRAAAARGLARAG